MEPKISVTPSREAPLIPLPSQVNITLLFVKFHFNIFLQLLLFSYRAFSFSTSYQNLRISPLPPACPMHLILRDMEIVTTFYEAQEIVKLLIMSVFQPPFTSSRIGPNISNTGILYSFSNVRDHVSDSYKTKDRTVIPCVFNLYKPWEREREANKKDSDMKDSKQSLNLILLHFVFQCNVDVLVSFNKQNFNTFSKGSLPASTFRVGAVFWWRYINIHVVFY